jgi:hypothetical protein
VTPRVQYLKGLRGLGSCVLHFVTAFLPIAAEHALPPLKLLFDGHTAVYVFFPITGAGFALVVLIIASAFERWIDRPAIQLSRRLATQKRGSRPDHNLGAGSGQQYPPAPAEHHLPRPGRQPFALTPGPA